METHDKCAQRIQIFRECLALKKKNIPDIHNRTRNNDREECRTNEYIVRERRATKHEKERKREKSGARSRHIDVSNFWFSSSFYVDGPVQMMVQRFSSGNV